MMAQVTVNLPDAMVPYADDFELFINVMVRKLWISREKGFVKPEAEALWPLIDGIIMLVSDSKDANGYPLR